jgi:hypothetical protein
MSGMHLKVEKASKQTVSPIACRSYEFAERVHAMSTSALGLLANSCGSYGVSLHQLHQRVSLERIIEIGDLNLKRNSNMTHGVFE